MTQVIRLDPERPRLDAIEQAASIILEGGLVAFPTETVYGLGADAMNEGAVQRIFEAKGRPADNPLIVHISDRAMLNLVATDLSARAEQLIERFWPGPLTLVLPALSSLPSALVHQGYVGVRQSAHPVAAGLVRAFGAPLTATRSWTFPR